MATVIVANANVQTNTRRNGSRITLSWMIRPKFLNPTPVFQPGSSSSWPATNEPSLLSRNTAPSEMRTNASRAGS